MRQIISIAALSVAALLGGCAATVTQAPAAAPGAAASEAATRRVIVALIATPAVREASNWQAFREEWQTAMTAAASQLGVGVTVVVGDEVPAAAPAVLVRLKVNDYRYVSQAARYGAGVFTGNAHMNLDAEFIELPGRRLWKTRKYETASSAWQGVFSAMTPKQVEAVSGEIMKEVTGR